MEKKKLQKRGCTFYLDNELVKELEFYAKRQQRSSSWILNNWLKAKLGEIKRKNKKIN